MNNPTASVPVKGVYSLLLTPFHESGEIDYATYERYVDWQLSQQPQALFASCGSSELLTLNAEERLQLTRIAVKRAGNIPVVATANAGSDPTAHRDELLRMAETGVSALVAVPPNDYGHDPSRLLHYFAELATASPLPLILYEFPGVAPHYIPPEVYGTLVSEHGVSGIKDTTSTLEGITAKLAIAPDSLVFQANTAFLVQAITAGANGIMAITSTAMANLNIRLWNRLQQNGGIMDDEVQLLHRELICLDALISNGFTATAKYLAALQGLPFTLKTRTGASLQPSTAEALRIWHETLDPALQGN
ncbi:dihydrodipicolinate synthase family protein [Paenibacillus agaridevorans]|uniref:dihydrodipicolinate synthase family protein n=1 Tax=Paenibacillus agaridevorans TaxID=171404 RepID=UPI001BE3DBB7|nr:dihydrodipicolinate synthase family protein [Paenibacillus agaridevorans]